MFMKYFSKYRAIITMAFLTLVLAISGITAEAKTITVKRPVEKIVGSVGDATTIADYCGNVKINGKKYSKAKKKVKTLVTADYADAFVYPTKSVFDYSSAYKSDYDYDIAHKSLKYMTLHDYEIRFLKAGTYTLTFENYSLEEIYSDYVGSDYYELYTYKNGTRTLVSNEYFTYKETPETDERYFVGEKTGKIYARLYTSGEYYSNSIVAASLKKGADGRIYVYYKAPNVVKTVSTYKYKILKSDVIFSSVQLGKAKYTKKNTFGAYKYVYKESNNKFLSGNSGKLTVKMGDKNYQLTSIIVETVDKDGKAVYKEVKNKKKVAFGKYKSGYEYKNEYNPKYKSWSKSLFKPTWIHISYKNKFTGEFSKNSVAVDGNGNQYIKTVYRYAGDTKNQEGTWFDGPCNTTYTFYKK